jgi:sialate O-acetylesterase
MRNDFKRKYGLAAFLVLWALFNDNMGRADVRLPAILSAHALLQKSPHTAIWGWAEPGETVTVTLGGSTAQAVTDSKGKWLAHLDLSGTGAGPFELQIAGKNKIVVPDVLVGDVWLSSGQSNMQYTLNATSNGTEEVARSSNPELRWFMAKSERRFLEPQEDVPGQWFVASPETSGDCSGVAYYFGKIIQADLKIPVGLVLTAVGGTAIQSWMSEAALDQDGGLKAEKDRVLSHLRSASAPKAKLQPAITPTYFYNQLIHPLAPLSLRGVIWYQGEAHFNQGDLYRKAFPLLIRDWRGLWQEPNLPFYYCQLPNLDQKTPDPGQEGWVADLRSAQDIGLAEPHTGEAVLIDVGGVELHPPGKEIVGARLAKLAEALTYNLPVAAQSPRFDRATTEGHDVVLHFSNAQGGLVAHALPADTVPNVSGSPVQGFALCAADRKWFWANASIEGDGVRVESLQVPDPVAVRYAWSNNPTCNLYNRDGLPAAPFQVVLEKKP